MRALTDQEQEQFEAIRNAGNIALVRTEFDGEETAAIVAINYESDSEDALITPLAVFITDGMFDRLTDPAADLADQFADPGLISERTTG